ncbi:MULTISPECIES: sensor histidine kinase [Nonomuraea]|uniref:histidine kinase n=2 Tax=Nonomuraea TaxID=83681 RepID=A0ABW1C293_9ACTN|nr:MULTISPECIES: nitrate- and nitrite sensing domain-containing protein [Nonomuraea]MDA0647235.1 nitrate- and nitrite sensing domain-containing protein [Nonomuraea ferruginea]TXK39794.1 HAMP domain-containing protein [Nonomuraea sp. C10]
MRFRNASVRSKVTALIVSLILLWAFAAWVTLREGVNLLGAATVDSQVVEPSEPLLVELQRERRQTIARIGAGSRGADKALRDQRARTDAARAEFAASIDSTAVSLAAEDSLMERIADVRAELAKLDQGRKSIDSGRAGGAQAAAAPYNNVIDSLYQMYDSVAAFDDKEIAKDGRTLSQIHLSREWLARGDALMAGVFARGGFTPDEHAEFITTAGVFRHTLSTAMSQLPDEDWTAFDRWMKSDPATRVQAMEQRLIQHDPRVGPLPVDAEEWRKATESTLADMQRVTLAAGDRLAERIVPIAVGVVVRLLLAGGLGLVAVIASIVLSITTTRQLLAQLRKLRDAAHELSDERLPRVVERIGHGEVVDVSKEVPDLDFGDNEIGQVGQAFNAVQHTAISVAAEQAELRRSIRDILLSLARRTQGLVHRQLTVLDVMERRETDPEELKELFRLDHLAIRMRRNAENLIVLSGSSPARTWRRSVPMLNVVRGALAEVEDYTRVTILPLGDVVLVGRAVGDVIHLLAELIENAVSFSPPYTAVQVSGQLVANGYVIEIEDRGLGMKPEDLASANERIADPPEFRITGTARLGLYVVSQLARRHDIQVRLKASPYGGTTVVVLLPQDLVEVDTDPHPHEGEASPALPRRAVAVAERAPATHNVRQLKVAADPARPQPLPQPVRDQPRQAPNQQPAPRAVPARTGESEETVEPKQPEFTPGGLPLRVPQANLAPALREEGPSTLDDTEEDDERSPEEIRAMMGSLQSGTRLGRTEAAKLMGEQPGGDS